MNTRLDGLKSVFFLQISGSFATNGSLYETSRWPTVFYDTVCTGEEASLWDCAYSLSDVGQACRFDAAVTCQGSSSIALRHLHRT